MKKLAITVIALSLSLQGCIFVAGAAAGAAAIAVINDHRSFDAALKDKDIASQANNAIRSTSELEDSHIVVTSFNKVVLLTGEVNSSRLRKLAEEEVQTVPDIKHIYNQILIKGTASTLSRASDSWITAKIKTKMLATEDLKSTMIKVITENGTVYLMGNVTREQADAAVYIARKVKGVQKVIRVFEYVES